MHVLKLEEIPSDRCGLLIVTTSQLTEERIELVFQSHVEPQRMFAGITNIMNWDPIISE